MKNEELFAYKQFGDEIKRQRLKNGWTQKQLADALNVTQGAIVKYEDGSRKMSISKLRELSRIFDISVENLLGIESQSMMSNIESLQSYIRQYCFTSEEIGELMDYAKYLIYKRSDIK